jgi:hypothetical protein
MTADGPQIAVRCPRHQFGWQRHRRFTLTLRRDRGPATCRDCRIVTAPRDETPPDRKGDDGPV